MLTRLRESTIIRAGLLGALVALGVASVASAESLVAVSDNNVVAASNNQVPVSACHNQVPVNAAAVQVPIQEVEAAAGVDALNPDSDSAVTQDESCSATMAQSNDVGDDDAGAQETEDSRSTIAVSDNNVAAASNNQVPVSACHNQVAVNAAGVQALIQEIAAAVGLALLSEGSHAPVTQDQSCDPTLAQSDHVGDGDG